MTSVVDNILYQVGSGINKVYSSDPLKPWCQTHYFKLNKGKCVGCEASKELTTYIDSERSQAYDAGFRDGENDFARRLNKGRVVEERQLVEIPLKLFTHLKQPHLDQRNRYKQIKGD